MKTLLLSTVLLGFIVAASGTTIPRNGVGGLTNTGLKVRPHRSHLLDVTLDERRNCSGGVPVGAQPPTRVDTAARVSTLIGGMQGRGYDAYIVPSADAHQSEDVAAADARRAYISGFSGSAGTAVILGDGQRALWTDGRYFLQADEQLDCQWLLMKEGIEGVPTISEWLISELSPGSVVSADARLIGSNTWIDFAAELSGNGISLVVDLIVDGNNLVDEQWNADGRPSYSQDPIYLLELQFTGKEWYDKISDIVAEMSANGAQLLVITALDETAWTLNLRGSDIDYNPVFRSYIIIDTSGDPVRVMLFVPDIQTKVPQDVLTALGIGNCDASLPCISLVEYDEIETELVNVANQASVSKVMIAQEFSTSPGASYYIYNLVPSAKLLEAPSPPLLMKASKNEVERAGMKNAHFKDAVAVISFMSFLEDQITSGVYWTEISAQNVLDGFRFDQPDNMGLSFPTISAFGPNGAIIHYTSTPETDVQITDQNLYLVDSGGQYKDGTTDITRTMHYGTPTPQQIEAYTRVLIGSIDFAAVIFPKGTGKYETDILARRSLYSIGLDYRHGTSHGIGSFLNVHEASDVVYELGFHGSDEPGYYEDGAWGIRIENVITVTNVTTLYDFVDESYGLEVITLVPLEPKLIDITMLTRSQCEYLNSYYTKIRDVMGPELISQNKITEYDWMIEKTQGYTCA